MSTTADKIAGKAIPALGKADKKNWKQIQERTFTNWFNDRLRGHLRVGRNQVLTGNLVGYKSVRQCGGGGGGVIHLQH